MLMACLLFGGCCIGSFITMLSYRYPQMLLARGSAAKRLNLFTPGSHCVQCEHPLAILDNVPLVSYLWLRGRCRYCQAAIGCCYWFTELVTVLVTMLIINSYAHSPVALPVLLGSLLFSWMLIALAVIDWRSGLLPDRLTLGLLWLGLLFQVVTVHIPVAQAVLGAALGYLLLWGLFQAHHRLTGRRGMGYGDFKLAAALGAWLGCGGLLTMLWLASLLALLAFVAKMCFDRYATPTTTTTASTSSLRVPLGQQRLAFGPYLALAGWWVFMNYPLPELWLPLTSSHP